MARPLSSLTKVLLALALAVALLVGAAIAVIGLLRTDDPVVSAAECTVPTSSGPALELTAVNLQHASTINAVGLAKDMERRARIIAIATAYQESTLRNLPDGDRDSVGLFQQRPSQGWGTVAQISDPVYSAGIFYDRLLDVQGWRDLPLTEAAQAVQYSGYPDAYAKWEDEATALVDALSGADPPALACRAGAAASTAPAPVREPIPGSADLSGELSELLAAAEAELGGLLLTGFTADGLTATVEVTVADLEPTTAGRTLAAWFVAHQAGTDLSSVEVLRQRWADHTWSRTADLPAGTVEVALAATAD